MCGICGIFDFSSREGDLTEALVVRMRDRMIHRGPDDAGWFISEDKKIGLGHRRLSIIDLSARARQPMCNEEGTIWIVYNGEVYNHLTLRRALEKKGHRYRSKSDTETILHLYEEKGIDCVEDLEGMFAFAIWDSRENKIFLARDRIGIKPLYYTIWRERLIFASEIKAILEHPGIERDVDLVALYHYLTFVVAPPPRTMFKGISKLEAGCWMTVDGRGNIAQKRYWDAVVPADAELDGQSEEFYVKRIRTLLSESIEKRMMSDVPFGVFLSGGIDSSLNVALMSRTMDRPVDTFSVGYKGQEQYNELRYARQIAGEFGTNHHEILIDEGDLIDYLPDMIYHQDEPIADPVCFPLYYVSKLTKDSGTTVVQVGEGSDELFCGYDNYMLYLRLYRRLWRYLGALPAFVRKMAYLCTTPFAKFVYAGEKKSDFMRRAAYGEELFWGNAVAFWEGMKPGLLSKNFREAIGNISSREVVETLLERIAQGKPEADFLERMIYLEMKLRLPELLLMRVDKIAMSTSVEARVPFLDHHLVECAMHVPSALKTKDGISKYILKKAAEGLIPDNIIHRRKMGFWAPIREWFRGELAEYGEEKIFNSPVRKREWLNYDFVREMMDRHRAGKGNFSFYLWNLFNFSLWYEQWIG